MRSICGADCENCGYGCPFGERCMIAGYIKRGGMAVYNALRHRLRDEFNTPGVKLLCDRQVPCLFDDGSGERCFGLAAGTDFLLVSEYGVNCADPQIVLFKRR